MNADDKWLPWTMTDGARRTFAASGVDEAEGERWLEAGWGPLGATALISLGLSLSDAIRGRAVGLNGSAYERARSYSMSALEAIQFVEAAIESRLVEAGQDRNLALQLLAIPLEDRDDRWEKLRCIVDSTASGSAAFARVVLDSATIARFESPLEDAVKVIQLVAAGTAAADVVWTMLNIVGPTREAWRNVGVGADEARLRIRNEHRPIDAFDGVLAEQKLEPSRAREVAEVRDTPLSASRSSGKPLPAMVLEASSEAEMKQLLEQLGFRVVLDRLDDRIMRSIGRGVVAEVFRGERSAARWVVDIEASFASVRTWAEPADAGRTPAASLRSALEALPGLEETDLRLELRPVGVGVVELVETLNTSSALSWPSEITIDGTPLELLRDPDGRRGWVPSKILGEPVSLASTWLVAYGEAFVSYPGPSLLGIGIGRDTAQERWRESSPICLVGDDAQQNIAVHSEAGGFIAMEVGRELARGVSLSSCLAALLKHRPELEPEEDWPFVVMLRPGEGHLAGELLASRLDGASCMAGGGTKYDVRRPKLSIDGVDFVALRAANGADVLVRAEQCNPQGGLRVIARIRLCELDSRTAGDDIFLLGELPNGDLLMVSDIDEGEGEAILRVQPTSRVEAVRDLLRWPEFGSLDLEAAARVVYVEGREVRRASDIEEGESDSLEIDLQINLTDADLEELWRLLESEMDEE